jgi:hypothetical protein
MSNPLHEARKTTGFHMRLTTPALLPAREFRKVRWAALAAALALCAPLLSACAQRHQGPTASTLNEDDDTYCRADGKVAPGSSEYVACRRERDTLRSAAVSSSDKKQRDLGDYMINHPTRP